MQFIQAGVIACCDKREEVVSETGRIEEAAENAGEV